MTVAFLHLLPSNTFSSDGKLHPLLWSQAPSPIWQTVILSTVLQFVTSCCLSPLSPAIRTDLFVFVALLEMKPRKVEKQRACAYLSVHMFISLQAKKHELQKRKKESEMYYVRCRLSNFSLQVMVAGWYLNLQALSCTGTHIWGTWAHI